MIQRSFVYTLAHTHTWVIVLKIEITGMLTFALLHDSKWAINTGQYYVLIQLLVYQAYIA